MTFDLSKLIFGSPQKLLPEDVKEFVKLVKEIVDTKLGPRRKLERINKLAGDKLNGK